MTNFAPIVIKNTVTGEVAIHHGEPNVYMWTTGNYGCDCARALFFARALGRPDPEEPCGDGKYVVVSPPEIAG